MTITDDNNPEIEALWRDKLIHGHHTRIALLPGSPRCTVYHVEHLAAGLEEEPEWLTQYL